jgi:hypothetical protein
MGRWTKTAEKPSELTFELRAYPTAVVQNERDIGEAQRQNTRKGNLICQNKPKLRHLSRRCFRKTQPSFGDARTHAINTNMLILLY